MPRTIFDLDITDRIAKLAGNILGNAHEHYVTAILMRLGFDVAISCISSSTYDLIITAYENGVNSARQFLKTKIINCAKSINFGAIKEQNDLIIGVKKDTLDLYFVPTALLKQIRKSKSLKHLDCLKNNWDILLNWREIYLNELFKKL